jgi:hypothetical protein
LWNGEVDEGHDLALVRLPRDVITGTTGTYEPVERGGDPSLGVQPVQVGAPFDPGAYAAGTEAFMVGRGHDSSFDPSPEQLRDLDTVLRSDDDMDDIYNAWIGFDHWDSTLMIGAGFTNHTVCVGDSGGPLTVVHNGRVVQVGVASFVPTIFLWGDPTCDEPGGYMELGGPQLAWLATKVPSIMAGWGPCTTSTGAPGDPYAIYGTNYSGGVKTDGPYRWALGCQSSTPPADDGGQDGPNDHVCVRKPWLCPGG